MAVRRKEPLRNKPTHQPRYAMSDEETSNKRDEIHELIGALDILTILREEMEEWLEEAQNASKQEALENVLGHVEAMEEEYKIRLRAAESEDLDS
jgi:hypothetical protein